MTAPLIGRTNLARALDAAIGARDHPAVVLRGPAGSGKTVLAEAAVNAALTRGALTGSGKYAEGDTPSPYDPIMRALSEAVGRALDRMHDPEPVMASMAETLGSALAILTRTGFRADAAPAQNPSPAVIGRREGAARVIDAVLQLARWLAGFERPIVLPIDDWRRGGADARALLDALSSEGVELRLTLVLTERDEASFDYPADETFIGRAIAFPIEVGGLAWEDRRALLDTILGEAGETVFEWLGPDCPALPFDLIAAARELKASDAVRLENGRWLLDSVRAATLGREDLARSLAARLDGLCPDAGRIALGAALWGDGAPAPTLLEAIELAPAAFEAAFDQVATLGLLRRQGEDIRFVHDRLRSAVLARGESAIPALAVQMSERLARRPAGTWAAVAAPALRLRAIAGAEGAETETWRDRFAQGSREARARMEVDAANDFA
ncbi:MAG: AAA family ATPase, partial [Caulobacteraceae bacterium]